MANKQNRDIVRSSTAEYLTFISATGESGVEVLYAEENIWLSQKIMATLYEIEPNTVNYHLKKIFSDSELDEHSVIRKFRITANDGKSYETLHYKLTAIIAVGYKVNSERAVQFRKWATQIVQEFTIKGFAMNDERFKNLGGGNYWKELIEHMRDIRSSGKVMDRQIFESEQHSVRNETLGKITTSQSICIP